MPSRPNHSLASIAYGSGSNKKNEPKPDWRTAFTPPPNRLQHLDCTRYAGFDRKVRGAALAESLLLDWLEDQALNTVSSQINLAELNRATRILYRLTAIQKTLMGLHSELHKDPNRPEPGPGGDVYAPIELLDDESDDDDVDPELDLPVSSPSPAADPALPEDDPAYDDEDEGEDDSEKDEGDFEVEEPTLDEDDDFESEDISDEEDDAGPIDSMDPASQSPDADGSGSNPSDVQSAIQVRRPSGPSRPQSAISSARAASVRAVPALPHLDEAYLERTLALAERLTGAAIPVDERPTPAPAPAPDSPGSPDAAPQADAAKPIAATGKPAPPPAPSPRAGESTRPLRRPPRILEGDG